MAAPAPSSILITPCFLRHLSQSNSKNSKASKILRSSELEHLKNSIAKYGLLKPFEVAEMYERLDFFYGKGKYLVIDGQRRYFAVRELLKLPTENDEGKRKESLWSDSNHEIVAKGETQAQECFKHLDLRDHILIPCIVYPYTTLLQMIRHSVEDKRFSEKPAKQDYELVDKMADQDISDLKSDDLRELFRVRSKIEEERASIEETIKEIERRGWKYVLGVRMRKSKEVKDKILSQGGCYQQVFGKSKDSKAPSPLKVKEVSIGSKRYIVCLNEDQAAKDKADRNAIVESLREALKRGDKSLIGNKGYRRFVASQGQRFVIDEQKVMQEARYDGKWVLTTNTNLSAKATALKYKQLWMVESIFRSMKSLLETRPIFHKCDATIRGHVFCSFLALLLRKELENRLEQKGFTIEWADVIRDLDNLVEMEIEVSDKRYTIRSNTEGTIAKVFGACGVALPPLLSQC